MRISALHLHVQTIFNYNLSSNVECHKHQFTPRNPAIDQNLYCKMSTPYPFKFTTPEQPTSAGDGSATSLTLTLENVRGRIPSPQASRLRTMMLEAHNSPDKIIAHACSYDGLSSRLVEEAGFPIVFLAGYPVASSFGLPDTGYIAMEDQCNKIQEVVRMVNIPVMADGDTGYGSPMNVKRTVECFAKAGAAGVMIEDQTWPKRGSPALLHPGLNR
jgi:methylisocitrate lyase